MNLLEKDFAFNFNESCLKEFNVMEERIVTTSIIVGPN